MKKQILILMAVFAFSFNANALFELRAGYGVNTPAESDADLQGGGAVGLSTMAGFNLDALFQPPVIPFGFGIRYENMGMDVSQTADPDLSSDLTRISAIINYRFIEAFLYVGVIGTIGITNDLSIDTPGGELEYDADLTYSVGGEAGFSFGLFMVGAELGYSIATYKAKNINASSLDEIDFGGIYAKALVGVGF